MTSADTPARRVTWLLLLATLLVGLAHLAFLPPFEGFDETAHWSYVQELSDLGHPPRYGVDALGRDIDLYPGPHAYSGAAPFDQTGHATYRSYRRAGAPSLAGGPGRFQPTAQDNWQAQHPPLYFWLLTPVYRAARGLGWVNGLLALRLASFAMAWAGFALGVLGARRQLERFGPWTAPIMAGWPFLFPQFFPEFARLGNDSLCLLCMGLAWTGLVRLLDPEEEAGWGPALLLGLGMGAGLLAKAFFLPFGAGVAVLLLLRWWGGGRRRALLARIVAAGALAIAIGGWWYVQKRLETGSLTGSDEFIRLKHAGGFRLIVANFSGGELVRGLLVLPATFVWAGTWSLARLPEMWLAAPLLLIAVAGIEYLRRLGKGAPLLAWAPLALATPMAVGLVYHIFVWMAGTSAVTPGWYFHILAAPLGLAVAIGWRRPIFLGAMAGLTGLYTLFAWAFQLSMFSGCAAKIGDDKHYSLAGAGCFIDPQVLARLAHPALGAAAFSLGALLALGAAGLAVAAYARSGVSDQAGGLQALG